MKQNGGHNWANVRKNALIVKIRRNVKENLNFIHVDKNVRIGVKGCLDL